MIDPSKRLGAGDDAGYPSIKKHPFFENIDFNRLHETTPPQIQSYVSDPEEPDSVWAKFPDMEPGMGPGAMTRMLRLQIEEGSLDYDRCRFNQLARTSKSFIRRAHG